MTLGRFRLVRRLVTVDPAAVALGATYAAVDLETDDDVAVRMLMPEQPLTDDLRTALAAERRALDAAGSTNLVPVIAAGEYDEIVLLVSPLVEAGSLADRLARPEPLGRRQALTMASQVCRGLYDAHRVGIVHGGVRPTNVFHSEVDGQSIAQLADGGALLRSQRWVPAEPVENVSSPYDPPERVVGAPASVADDLYALAHLLRSALGADLTGSDARDSVDSSVSDFLARALHPDPAERYPDSGTMGRALAELVEADRAAVPSQSVLPEAVAAAALGSVPVEQVTSQPSQRRRPSRRLLAILAAGVVAVVVVVVSLGLGHGSGSPSDANPPTPKTSTAPLPVPTVSSSAGDLSVRFALTKPAGAGVVLQVQHGNTWREESATTLSVPTSAGGAQACLQVRAARKTGSTLETSAPVSSCGTSLPASVRTVRVVPNCVRGGFSQVCYRLDARGFRPNTSPTLTFTVNGSKVASLPIPIGKDGTGALPSGQHFNFSATDAGALARITLGSASYQWRVAKS